MRRSILMCAIALAFGGVLTGAQAPQPPAASGDAALIARAKAIHERVIALDTHNDINPGNFQFSYNYTQDLGNQVNLPKMKKGGLDASFFIVYVGQGELTPEGYTDAYRQAVDKFEAIHRLTKVIAPDQIELALTADDVRRINAKGKKIALIGIENGYALGDERTAVNRVKEFYMRGGRYMSLAHNGHSQLSDSNTGERDGWKWNGLSPLGKQVIPEMNKWGIMIDVSHPSKESMMQTLALTKAPIIASHSAVRALCNHSRNMDDEQLLALKKNGGVIQMVAFSSYVKEVPPPSAERTAAMAKLNEQFGLPAQGGGRGGRGGGGGGGRGGAAAQLGEEKRAEYQKALTDLNAQFPAPPRATVKDFVDHIDYAVKRIGIDHVGISSDFDGGGGVDGWNGAQETINVTIELVRRGYTEAQIAKMWSGNLLRVMDEVQKVARGMQASTGTN
jgi:membrane dipeptidase